MSDQTNAAQIAKGLTKAQREAVTGELVNAMTYCRLETAFALSKKGLVSEHSRHPRLTPLGEAVRAHLLKEQGQ